MQRKDIRVKEQCKCWHGDLEGLECLRKLQVVRHDFSIKCRWEMCGERNGGLVIRGQIGGTCVLHQRDM